MESLNIVLVVSKPLHTEQTQIPSSLCMAGWVYIYVSPLNSQVDMSVALTKHIFKKKSLWIFLVEIVKVFIVVKLLQ